MSKTSYVNYYRKKSFTLLNDAQKNVKRSKKLNQIVNENFNLYNDIIDLYILKKIKTLPTLQKQLNKVEWMKPNLNLKKFVKKNQFVVPEVPKIELIYPDIEKEIKQNVIKLDQGIINNFTILFDKDFDDNKKSFLMKVFLKYVDEIMYDKKILLELVDPISKKNTFMVLNDNVKKHLSEYVKNNFEVENNGGVSVSDAECDQYFLFGSTCAVKVSLFVKTNKYNKESGEFFKYLNKTDIDLTEYQIYNQDQFNNADHSDCCLMFSLKKLGISVEKLQAIKIMIKDRNIPLSDLEKITEKIKIRINLKKIQNEEKRNRVFIYGKKYDEEYNIGLIDEHYFPIYKEKTNYTSYSINNYENIKHLENFNKIFNDKLQTKNDRFIDSFDLIKLFYENKDKLLEPITFNNSNIAQTQFYDKIEQELTTLKYDDNNDCRLIETKEKKKNNKTFDKIFFDFETYTDDENIHQPYLLCALYPNGEIKTFTGLNCAINFLKTLTNHSILIAHNVTYDYRFLINELYEINEISRGSRLIGCSAKFNKFEIKIKDSYHLIGQPLRAFSKIFNLDVKKEIMPYSLYKENTINEKWIDLKQCLLYVNQEDKEHFIKNVNDWNLLQNDKVDIITYSKKYCELDVLVLYKGYEIFRSWMIEHFKIECDECLTIASLSHKYLINEGCYDNVYELGGIPQKFIQGCVVGGRTMCSNNDKQIFNIENEQNKKMQDFDAVSLYPSAMKRMNGFLIGKPKVLDNLTYDFLKNQSGYFVEIKIKKVNVNRSFSLMSYKTEEGIRLFTNDMIDKIIKVDKYTLEDLIEFQKIEFKIIRGYYFNEGHNDKINETIQYIFSKRLELKK